MFDANPLNAIIIPNGQNAFFTPIEKVKVYLQSQFNNGVIITYIPGNALEVDLTDNPSATIHYDGSQFLDGPL